MVLTANSSIHTKPLRFAAFPDPQAGPGEVVIRVGACAACRTDLQICEGDVRPRMLPVIPGHQVAGRIEAVGEGVHDWSEGDRAGLTWLAGTCGECGFDFIVGAVDSAPCPMCGLDVEVGGGAEGSQA